MKNSPLLLTAQNAQRCRFSFSLKCVSLARRTNLSRISRGEKKVTTRPAYVYSQEIKIFYIAWWLKKNTMVQKLAQPEETSKFNSTTLNKIYTQAISLRFFVSFQLLLFTTAAFLNEKVHGWKNCVAKRLKLDGN